MNFGDRTIRTFAVSLDAETAAKLESFISEHCRATPESVIEQVVSDAMADADPHETALYRRHLGRQSAERAMRGRHSTAKRTNRRRVALEPPAAGEPRQVEVVSVSGFFGTFTFAADRTAYRQFAEACAALNMDRSEALFDGISIAMEGAIATAAALHSDSQ